MTKIIQKGGFGILCKGENIHTKENVAIKIEYNGRVGLLLHETKILRYLYEKRVPNIPPVYWFGPYKEEYRSLVMPFYECSLYEVLTSGNRNVLITNNNTNNIIRTMIETIEHIHQHYVLHRDIKPHNIMLKNDGNIVIIDFGLSTFYINDRGEHIENVNVSPITEDELVGSSNYVSWNIHMGDIPSRRDDMISIGYIWWMLLLKSLGSPPIENIPWFSCSHLYEKGEHKKWERLEEILDRTNTHYICKLYMEYCYELEFNETPDYRGILKGLSVIPL
jgi:serine/threonine protein kinase